MAQVLVTKPSSVSAADRSLLHDAGIIVIETYEPSAIKLLEVSDAGIGGSGLLWAALRALNSDETYTKNARASFASHVLSEVDRARAPKQHLIGRDNKGRFVAPEQSK